MESRGSAVWNYYKKLTSDCVQCLICDKKYSRKGRSSTNLKNHLRSMHLEQYDEIMRIDSEAKSQRALESSKTARTPMQKYKAQSQTLEDLWEKKKLWDINSSKSKSLDFRVAEMIVTEDLPFSHVETTGFTRLMKEACPQYKVKKRLYYTALITDDLYVSVFKKIKAILKSLTSDDRTLLSFTTDAWSETSAGVSLLSLTCHAIDSNYDRINLVLSAEKLEERHTGQYISEKFQSMLEKWEIDSHVHCVVRDAGANMKKALFLSGLNNLDCTAHKLQLVVKSGLTAQQSVSDVVAKLRSISAHFNHSVMAQDELKQIQSRIGAPTLSVIRDSVTRWNSTLHMMQRFLELKESLSVYCADHKVQQLTNDDFTLLSAAISLLKPFDDITNQLSHSNTSISEVIPLIESLKHVLHQTALHESDFIGSNVDVMNKTLNSELLRRFENIESNDLYAIATYLDPKFKSKFFKLPSTLKRIQDKITLMCDELKQSAKNPLPNDEADEPLNKKLKQHYDVNVSVPGPSDIARISTPTVSLYSSMAAILGSSSDEENDQEFSESSKQLLETFHKEKRIKASDNSLEWWKRKKYNFPILCILARTYLACPATSVPSEQLFSGAGNIYDEKRTRLLADKAEKLLFLKYNLPLINYEYDCN